jgi:hypothetical protein
MTDQTLSANQLELTSIVNEVMKEDPSAADSPEKLLEKVAAKFLNNKLDCFPIWCCQMWQDNQKRLEFLREAGTRGKFDIWNKTETYWSNDRNFMSAEDVPKEMYLFMQNFVYRNFWGDDKVWRPFVRAICNRKGPMTKYEAENLLIKVKQLYGSNSDLSLTR